MLAPAHDFAAVLLLAVLTGCGELGMLRVRAWR
jgi:hypothetical protein